MKNKVNVKYAVGFFAVVALIVFCAYVMIHGITVGVYDIGKIENHMHYGLDLTGGVNVVLQATPNEGQTLDSDKMDSTVAAITNRIDSLGVAEATVTKQD